MGARVTTSNHRARILSRLVPCRAGRRRLVCVAWYARHYCIGRWDEPTRFPSTMPHAPFSPLYCWTFPTACPPTPHPPPDMAFPTAWRHTLTCPAATPRAQPGLNSAASGCACATTSPRAVTPRFADVTLPLDGRKPCAGFWTRDWNFPPALSASCVLLDGHGSPLIQIIRGCSRLRRFVCSIFSVVNARRRCNDRRACWCSSDRWADGCSLHGQSTLRHDNNAALFERNRQTVSSYLPAGRRHAVGTLCSTTPYTHTHLTHAHQHTATHTTFYDTHFFMAYASWPHLLLAGHSPTCTVPFSC